MTRFRLEFSQLPTPAHVRRQYGRQRKQVGVTEIAELRRANFKVRRGVNDRRPGVAAVRARREDGPPARSRRPLSQPAHRSRHVPLGQG